MHFSNTTQPIQIDKIVIERNFRERRKLEVEREFTERIVLGCGFSNCKNEAVGKAIWLKQNQEYPLCLKHLDLAKKNKTSWAVIK